MNCPSEIFSATFAGMGFRADDNLMGAHAGLVEVPAPLTGAGADTSGPAVKLSEPAAEESGGKVG